MDNAQFEKQLQALVDDFNALAQKSEHKDLSDLPKHERQALVTRAVAAVHRITGPQSSYSKEVERILHALPTLHTHTSSIIGVVQALLSDLKNDHIKSLVELVHADLFSDFLEMANHLLEAGYKDASAVVAGSALEVHLRALCQKNSVSTEIERPDGTVTAKKAESMNSDLAKGDVYSKLDQKSVTAWLDLRNKAAHGKYAEYQAEQVALLIAGIREFIRRSPA